jgi:hypothetical protein
VVIFTARLFYPTERWFGRGFSLGSGEDKRLLILRGIELELLGRPARGDYTNRELSLFLGSKPKYHLQ